LTVPRAAQLSLATGTAKTSGSVRSLPHPTMEVTHSSFVVDEVQMLEPQGTQKVVLETSQVLVHGSGETHTKPEFL
jgi:hypothetical protein